VEDDSRNLSNGRLANVLDLSSYLVLRKLLGQELVQVSRLGVVRTTLEVVVRLATQEVSFDGLKSHLDMNLLHSVLCQFDYVRLNQKGQLNTTMCAYK
jgi:hypothetical protein